MNWSWPGQKINQILSKREQIFIILLLFFLIIYTYYIWLLLPLLNEIASIEMENRQLLAQVSHLQQSLQENPGNNALLGKDKSLELFQLVPAKPAIPEAISSLQKMAEESGVILERVYYKSLAKGEEDKSRPGDLQEEYVEIRVLGGYDELRAFIFRIEQRSKRIMILNQSRIQRMEADFWSEATVSKAEQSINLFALPQLKADLSIKLFYDHISMPET